MGHVLIIEDEMLIAWHLESLIADIEGTTTEVAATEKEAVDMARARTPALIVSDVRLAEGCGPAAVAIIRECLGPVPVIYVTGNPDLVPGGAPVIVKPVRDDLLTRTVTELLSQGSEAGEPA